MVISADKRQSRTVMRYITGLLENVPLLSSMVEHTTRETVDLNNGITIEVHVCNYRSTRGYTVAAVIADELAFWRDESSFSPDSEVLAALRPAMSTIPGSLLLGISSPYRRSGVLWDGFRKHFGHYGPTLIWKANTLTMNPSVDRSIIDAAYEEDASRASAEYGAEFRSDLEDFVSREVVDAAVVPGRYELPWFPQTAYRAFCDPSGGSADSFTIAVAHPGIDGTVVLDAIRERKPPFSPDDVCQEFANILGSYGLSEVYGDRYAGEWPRERFAAHGIAYRTSEKTKSKIYLETLPLLNAGRVELLDNPRLISQLCGLERRTSRSGKDSIDHSVGGRDDVCNSACGAITLAQGKVEITDDMWEWGEGYIPPVGVSLVEEGTRVWTDL